MFDDHRVDRQRTVEFIRANQSLLRTISSSDELTENMMLLLPSRVYGFVLRSRRWHFLNIDNIRPLERHSDGFESLILPPGVARLVESLVETHDPQNMPSLVSSVSGNIKSTLFAEKLDEADVFLQARDRENMRRNSVVSVFLRVLEYYSGILFLTTNKVGHFDEAFKSRIHVSLYYPALDKRSTLKVWNMNLERLAKSKKGLQVEAKEIYEYAKRHYKELYKKGRTTWNGRQIKKAFQTAVALAEFDANKRQGKAVLALEHFKVVAKASEDFDEYLCRVHGGNEADLAKRYMQRDDDLANGRRDSLPYSVGGLRSGKRHESSASSSSSSSEESQTREKKKRRKEKKRKKKSERAKEVAKAAGSEYSSSESE
ncbi:MAG: hypothetical protein Q9181_004362 [Wetmoreana brouardii]